MGLMKVVGSGSKGNCYLLEAGGETLILDLGCKWHDVLRELEYKISNCYALVSHVHQDHTKCIPQVLKAQLSVYSCQEVADKYKGVKVLKPKARYKIGSFTVMPLPVPHNAENYAYIIEHDEFGKLVFCTDATSFPYKVKGVNHLLIEANYDEDIVIEHLCSNEVIASHNENHMEIDKTIEVIRQNLSPDLNTIILCHLSDGQSNELAFRERVFSEFCIPTDIALAGKCFILEKDDF